MQQPRPTFGLLSLAMPALSVVLFTLGVIFSTPNSFFDPILVLVLTVLGLPFIGIICASISLMRQERPTRLSINGLNLNLAIPIFCFVCMRMGK